MLYDRPYMRQPQAPHPTQRMPVVTLLLIITICVFVLQQLFNVLFPNPYLPGNENAFMAQWFALSGENFRALKIWTLLSYSFLHSTQSLMHLIGNMLGLFFIGRILEPILGRHKFLLLYFSGAVCGGLLYLLLHFSGSTVVVGASAAVFALLGVLPNPPGAPYHPTAFFHLTGDGQTALCLLGEPRHLCPGPALL